MAAVHIQYKWWWILTNVIETSTIVRGYNNISGFRKSVPWVPKRCWEQMAAGSGAGSCTALRKVSKRDNGIGLQITSLLQMTEYRAIESIASWEAESYGAFFLVEASSNWWKKSSWRHGLWATIRPANYSIFSTYFSTCSPAHMKTQNCMIAWVGGDLKINLVPPPRHVLSRLVRKLNWIMNQTITYHSLSVKKAKYILS